MNSEVWINGQFLGRRPYGFIGFRYDLTEFLKTDGSPNVLAVRVDDSLEPSLRWYAGSGIYRHVRLITTSYTHFRLDGGIIITTPEITPEQATVEASYIIDANFFTDGGAAGLGARMSGGASRPAAKSVLRSSVLAPDGTVVASTESKITLENMHPGQRATQRITVPKPRLWSDTTPELYRLRSTLSWTAARWTKPPRPSASAASSLIPTAASSSTASPPSSRASASTRTRAPSATPCPRPSGPCALPTEGDGLQRHPHQPSSLRAGVLRPVRSDRLLRLR